jgi:alkylated DNA repair dioxygenase AlkB
MGQLNMFDAGEGLVFPENLLDFDPHFIEGERGMELLQKWTKEVPWQQQSIQMYGKLVLTPRLTAWYGDVHKTYRFSGTRFDPLPWTPELMDLRQRIIAATGMQFNSVLLNFYRNGDDSVAWHSDNERELGTKPHIASLSVGQGRNFEFRHKTHHQKKYSIRLENGSLLIMKGDLQTFWEHRIPKSAKETGARINLTFRLIS